ncbi:MAG: hypothetical protein OXL41_02925, partial [Nitrospinae bacterium]|nr:hypothetical protein [Nitrospinota bacterium]
MSIYTPYKDCGVMAEYSPGAYKGKPTRATSYLAGLLEKSDKPVLTQFDFLQIVRQMYRESPDKKLYLRHVSPSREDYFRLRSSLKNQGVIGHDRDYGARVIRVLAISDLPAEGIVCLVDPTCYISHLSAMQRWGLTDRRPDALMLTRPDRKTTAARLRAYMAQALGEGETNLFPLKIVGHPPVVRRRAVRIHESKTAGAFLKTRGDGVSLSTIGQTFLDMLQRPDLCGGMSHVLDVWEEHAKTYF